MGLTSAGWDALAQVVLAVGAVGTAASATYTYRKSKRAEAARWAVELFRAFYSDPEMSRARELLEYDFDDVAAPLLELRVLDRHVVLSEQERSNLRDLDFVLNFLEQLLYLEGENHLAERDRRVFFEYWFDQLSDPRKPALRRYLRKCGYERCSDFLGLSTTEYFVAYGSIMSAEGGAEEASARAKLRSLGTCHLRGSLYSRGEYPALVPSTRYASAELFEVLDESVFDELDVLEHYDPDDRAKSMYRRRTVRVEDRDTDAWVYYWNREVEDLEEIAHGSWGLFKKTGETA